MCSLFHGILSRKNLTIPTNRSYTPLSKHLPRKEFRGNGRIVDMKEVTRSYRLDDATNSIREVSMTLYVYFQVLTLENNKLLILIASWCFCHYYFLLNVSFGTTENVPDKATHPSTVELKKVEFQPTNEPIFG
jgi:hypothetical protein